VLAQAIVPRTDMMDAQNPMPMKALSEAFSIGVAGYVT
jgi:hypothetical protein